MKRLQTVSSSVSAAFLLAAVFVIAGGAFGAELIVDQKHPKAADANPGTLEAPFKTIQAAMDKAQPGDTVQVRGGVYHESVTFRRGGSYPGGSIEPWGPRDLKWLTLEAYKDEHVTLDGAVTIPADKWHRVEGKQNTYWTDFTSGEGPHKINMMFRGSVRLLPVLGHVAGKNSSLIEQAPSDIVPVMPGDTPADEGFYYDHQQKKLFLNLGGLVPGQGNVVRAAKLLTGIDAANQSFVRIRKFEVCNFIGTGIGVYNDHEFVAEDNYVHHCGHGFWGNPASHGMIRRNTVTDIMAIAMGLGGSSALVAEGNVIQRSHLNPYKIVAWDGSAVICNSAFGLVLRNNIISDCPDIGAIWPDVCSIGIAAYGNTIYNMGGCGFYIEASVQGTTLRWNTVFNNGDGIVFRQNWSNTAFENYTFRNQRSGMAIGSCDQDGLPKANAMVHNWVIDNGIGASFGPDLNKEPAMIFDHNTYKVPKDGVILQFGPKQYKDLAALRSEVGLEMHGKVVQEFDPTPLGLVTFRVAGTKKPWEPVPMFGNPNTERNDVLQSNEENPYFWKKGTFRGVEEYNWSSVNVGYVCATWGDGTGFVRQLRVPGKFSVPPTWDAGLNDKTAARPGNVACLQVGSVWDKTISSQGFGFWGTPLPTVDGAVIDVSLWVRARNVKATTPNGGLYVTVEFCDQTGQNATRQYLVSGPDGSKPAADDFRTGEYLYKQFTGVVTAPAGARWFKLGFGLRNCTGWVAFNDIDIKTRPGTPVQEAKRVLPIDPQQFSWTPRDLSGLLNRPLADDVDNDGKGGWTDQGPTMDLRNLQAGDYTYNHVAFRVAKGNACFVMKNKYRPSESLPDGGQAKLEGKADVLAFLHTGGWLNADQTQAMYIIHYADGSKVEIPIIGGRNIIDWVTPAERADELKYNEQTGLLLPAVSVPSPQFAHVTVWMLLWKNPHPDKPIASLEVKGANQGIPGLLGVSTGSRK